MERVSRIASGVPVYRCFEVLTAATMADRAPTPAVSRRLPVQGEVYADITGRGCALYPTLGAVRRKRWGTFQGLVVLVDVTEEVELMA